MVRTATAQVRGFKAELDACWCEDFCKSPVPYTPDDNICLLPRENGNGY